MLKTNEARLTKIANVRVALKSSNRKAEANAGIFGF
jgi:hypothetical protein